MVFSPPKLPRQPAKPLQLLPIRDFTGGLNLRDDAFQAKPNDLTETLNVDVQVTGGVKRRGTIARFSTVATSAAARNIWTFNGGTPQVLIQVGTAGKFASAPASGVFTETAAAPFNVAVTGLMRGATMARITGASANVPMCYIARNAEQVAVRWDGATGTALTVAGFNDNLAAPAGGKFPTCRYVRPHLNRMFAAWMVEGGVSYKNRVRFSHLGEPEDWTTLGYIDVDPGRKGDEITGLSSVGEELLVFKRKSIHIINGYSPETFNMVPLTTEMGAVSQEAIAANETHVAWFDQDRGVFLYDGKKITWLFEKLVAKIDDGTVQTAFRANTTLGWVGTRLYCSLTYGAAATTNTVVFVYDPQTGAWTVHQYGGLYGLGPMTEFQPSAALTVRLACAPSTFYVWSLENTTSLDDLDVGADTTFDSYFATAWFDAGAPGVRKRWRRPTFIADADVATTYSVSVWKDYKLSASSRTFPLVFTPPVLSGGALVWGSGVWGTATWGALTLGGQGLAKGSAFGNAIAVRLRIVGPSDTPWNMNAMQFRYVVGRIH